MLGAAVLITRHGRKKKITTSYATGYQIFATWPEFNMLLLCKFLLCTLRENARRNR